MDLELGGKRLQSVSVEFAVQMEISDVYFVVSESPFRLHVGGNTISLSPGDKPDDARQALRQLVGQTIEYATAFPGPDGALVVSTPGGELAIWKSHSNADESEESWPGT